MASSEEFLAYVLNQTADLPDVRHKKMMGEYLIYVDDVLVGGIYDDRLLLKDTEPGRMLMPEAHKALPYEGAKREMLIADCIDDAEALCEVLIETKVALSA